MHEPGDADLFTNILKLPVAIPNFLDYNLLMPEYTGSGEEQMASEPRPKFSAEIARAAAAGIVDELIGASHLDASDRDESISDLTKHGRQHMDGYEIAKALDDYAHWGVDFQMAEILDGFGHTCSELIRKAEKEWAARTTPQPPLPMGTRVRLSRGEIGTIDGVYEHGAAKYLVKVDGDVEAEPPHNSRRIINFEDARPEAEAA